MTRIADWLAVAVTSETDECLLWPFHQMDKGYGQVKIAGRTRLVSHVVLERTGHPRPPAPGDHALHSCPGGGEPACANPRHLRWGTNAENIADKVDAGRQHRPVGEKSPTARLTADAVREIRRRHVPGLQHVHDGGNTMALAAEYGVSRDTILAVVAGRTWKHVA